jgi:16S rRNA (cytidine1402-2'-O)-methyltransferase
MPALYVVATPVGNLEDVTLRALRILKEVKLIAAEDTRKTRKLLSAYDIHTPTTSYHEHNKLVKLDYILDYLEHADVALVSDAGMPGISDPGYELISSVIRHNIRVVPIPGPSALISALVVSGLPTDKFVYLGFLPHKTGERRSLLKARADEKSSLVVFESPHRLRVSLKDMFSILGDRRVAISRELTKIHEEVFRGKLSEAIEHFSSPKGEFTLVVSGSEEKASPELNADVESLLRELRNSGATAKAAIGQIAGETGLSKRALYEAWIKLK